MQQSYKSLFNEILQDVNGTEDKGLKDRVKYLINKNYFKLVPTTITIMEPTTA